MAAIVSNDYLNGFSLVSYEQFSFCFDCPFYLRKREKQKGKHKRKKTRFKVFHVKQNTCVVALWASVFVSCSYAWKHRKLKNFLDGKFHSRISSPLTSLQISTNIMLTKLLSEEISISDPLR